MCIQWSDRSITEQFGGNFITPLLSFKTQPAEVPAIKIKLPTKTKGSIVSIVTPNIDIIRKMQLLQKR